MDGSALDVISDQMHCKLKAADKRRCMSPSIIDIKCILGHDHDSSPSLRISSSPNM